MDAYAYEVARRRKADVSASAIGLLTAVADTGRISEGGVRDARRFIAEWQAAHEAECAAIDAPHRSAA